VEREAALGTWHLRCGDLPSRHTALARQHLRCGQTALSRQAPAVRPDGACAPGTCGAAKRRLRARWFVASHLIVMEDGDVGDDRLSDFFRTVGGVLAGQGGTDLEGEERESKNEGLQG
jgi:hypothetical protein